MENTNPIIPNPVNNDSVPVPSKRRSVLIIFLFSVIVIVGSLAVVNYLSNWKCADGEWIRDGFPLSRKPKGGCEMIKETKSATDSQKNTSEMSLEIPETKKFEANGIEITSLKSGDTINSPLIIKGRAKGIWYFEGSFPVKILDGNRKVIAWSYASAEGEWMTEDWVPFRSEIRFVSPNASGGFVLFAQDDPSGMAKSVYAVSIPVKFGKSSGEEISGSNFLEDKCGHDPMNDPILGDCGEDCNTDNWKIFTSKKYGYSFRYPADYALSNDCKNDSCVSVEENGDSVYMSGEHVVGDWPILYVRHLQNEHYNPPAQADIPGWIQKKFSWTEKCFPDTENIYLPVKDGQMLGGFNIYFPRSPQAHSRREIFYEYKGKIFQIEMIDVDSPQARQFYNIWLSAFSVEDEN